MADRSDRPGGPRDRTQVTPDPARPDFFKWLLSLFDGDDQKPEKLELRQAYGPGGRLFAEISIVQREFKANNPKPNREAIASLSNELLDLAQINCNEIGKPHRYAILAKNHTKSDKAYAFFLIKLSPNQPATYDPNSGPDDGDDEEAGNNDKKYRDAFLKHALDHIKQGDENERWRQDQHSKSTGDVIDKYQTLVDRLMTYNMEMAKEHRDLIRAADEALNHKADRDLKTREQEFKHQVMNHGFNFLKQMFPVAINQLTGKQTIPTKDSPESLGMSSFLEGLTDKQAELLFGEYEKSEDGQNRLKGNGIFTPQQAKIFAGVASGHEPLATLDQLFSGEHMITLAQITKAQTVVSPGQFMPLMALFMERSKKQLEAPAPQAPPPNPAPTT